MATKIAKEISSMMPSSRFTEISSIHTKHKKQKKLKPDREIHDYAYF